MGLFFSHKREKCEAFIDHYEIMETQNDMGISLRASADISRMNIKRYCSLVRQLKKATEIDGEEPRIWDGLLDVGSVVCREKQKHQRGEQHMKVEDARWPHISNLWTKKAKMYPAIG